MDVVGFCGECVVRDLCQKQEVCRDGVVDKLEIFLLFGREMWGDIHDGEVDIGIGKGGSGLPVECFQLFDRGLFGVLLLIVQTDRG